MSADSERTVDAGIGGASLSAEMVVRALRTPLAAVSDRVACMRASLVGLRALPLVSLLGAGLVWIGVAGEEVGLIFISVRQLNRDAGLLVSVNVDGCMLGGDK